MEWARVISALMKERFEDAAACYAKQGEMEKAMNVFSKMKLYEAGRDWVSRYRASNHVLCQPPMDEALQVYPFSLKFLCSFFRTLSKIKRTGWNKRKTSEWLLRFI